jgi:hypothetical protein
MQERAQHSASGACKKGAAFQVCKVRRMQDHGAQVARSASLETYDDGSELGAKPKVCDGAMMPGPPNQQDEELELDWGPEVHVHASKGPRNADEDDRCRTRFSSWSLEVACANTQRW